MKRYAILFIKDGYEHLIHEVKTKKEVNDILKSKNFKKQWSEFKDKYEDYSNIHIEYWEQYFDNNDLNSLNEIEQFTIREINDEFKIDRSGLFE